MENSTLEWEIPQIVLIRIDETEFIPDFLMGS